MDADKYTPRPPNVHPYDWAPNYDPRTDPQYTPPTPLVDPYGFTGPRGLIEYAAAKEIAQRMQEQGARSGTPQGQEPIIDKHVPFDLSECKVIRPPEEYTEEIIRRMGGLIMEQGAAKKRPGYDPKVWDEKWRTLNEDLDRKYKKS